MHPHACVGRSMRTAHCARTSPGRKGGKRAINSRIDEVPRSLEVALEEARHDGAVDRAQKNMFIML